MDTLKFTPNTGCIPPGGTQNSILGATYDNRLCWVEITETDIQNSVFYPTNLGTMGDGRLCFKNTVKDTQNSNIKQSKKRKFDYFSL